MDWEHYLLDALYAGLASLGFAAVSQPPRRAYIPIAILAACGHALRAALMQSVGMDIVGASFFAALVIGFGSFFFGKLIYCPMTVTYIPALLPMIPGMYAYRAVMALQLFVHHHQKAEQAAVYMQSFIINLTISTSVTFVLGVGAILPTLLLHKHAYMLTRRRPHSTTNSKGTHQPDECPSPQ